MNLFCKSTEETLDTVIKVAANAAGVAVAINNPALMTAILPVAVVLKNKIDGTQATTTDNQVINRLIQQGIIDLVDKVKASPIVMVEVNVVLNAIGVNIAEAKFPVLSNAVIIELIDSFVAGLQAGSMTYVG
jgi:hypothetical protein